MESEVNTSQNQVPSINITWQEFISKVMQETSQKMPKVHKLVEKISIHFSPFLHVKISQKQSKMH